MNIYGLQKTSLLDFPQYISAIIFTGGCNFNCPYCHNFPLLKPDISSKIDEDYVMDFLKKRINVLEGVVITGGEPTLQPDLYDFIIKIRKLGLLVKLDTNGSKPEVIKRLISDNMLDYIAMDIKSSPENYASVCGSKINMDSIKESISLIKQSKIPYEFRTTVVNGLHDLSDFQNIGKLINGADKCYLQNFKDNDNKNSKTFSSFTNADIKKAAEILQLYVDNVYIR